MSEADEERNREVLLEAFTAGWQAGLAVTISNPRVLAVVESCFEMWLREAADEVDVFGLSFRGRPELPAPSPDAEPLSPAPVGWKRVLAGPAAARADSDEVNRVRQAEPGVRIPTQRSAAEDAEGAANGRDPERRPGTNGRDLRRLLTRSGGRSNPKHRDATARDD